MLASRAALSQLRDRSAASPCDLTSETMSIVIYPACVQIRRAPRSLRFLPKSLGWASGTSASGAYPCETLAPTRGMQPEIVRQAEHIVASQ